MKDPVTYSGERLSSLIIAPKATVAEIAKICERLSTDDETVVCRISHIKGQPIAYLMYEPVSLREFEKNQRERIKAVFGAPSRHLVSGDTTSATAAAEPSKASP